MEKELEIVVEEKRVDIVEKLNLAWELAEKISKSTIIPRAYRNSPANCLIALEMSSKTRMTPIMVMQDLHIYKDTIAWSGKMIIALINHSGKFTKDLKYDIQGEGMEMSCVAYTFDKDGEKVSSPKVTMKMAKDEGWLDEEGSKWKTMPELMISYRSASFFGKLFCPELLMGLQSSEEQKNIEAPRVKTAPTSIFEEESE